MLRTPHTNIRLPLDLVEEIDALVAELREGWWSRDRAWRETYRLGWRRPTRTTLLAAAARAGLQAIREGRKT